MTPTVGHAILAVSDSLAGSIIVKATIAISLALVAASFMRRSRASIRHAVLAAGFAVLLVLPIAANIAPPIHIAVPMSQRHSSALAGNTQQFGAETLVAGQVASNSEILPPKSFISKISSLDLLFAVWAIGLALFAAPVVIGLWQVRSLRRASLPWSRENSIAATIANEAGLHRRVDVLLHESVAGPMTCGVMRPAILLPCDAETWNDEDLSRAIAHELEHVRRGDWLTHCFARVACAAYWFHPLVWMAWRKLTLEAERACDDGVLASAEATGYAEQLVALARRLSAAEKSPLLAMASRSYLAARVTAVLDSRQRRGRAGAFAITAASAFATLMLTTLSPLTIAAVQPLQAQQTNGVLPSFEVASVKPHKPRSKEIFPEFLPGGRFTEAGVPLRLVIALAYDVPVQSTLLSGGPNWISTNDEAYDIDAKAEDSATKALSYQQQVQKMRLMLQSLLADRFRLVVRREMKRQPVYILTVAKNGPKLQKSKLDQQTCQDATALCGSGGGGQGQGIHYKAATVDEIVSLVNNFTDRPLLNRTDITGVYDVDTTGWAPLRGGPRPADAQIAANPEAEAVSDPSRPTLFMVFDKLGLKMAPSQAPVESFEIMQLDRPTEN